MSDVKINSHENSDPMTFFQILTSFTNQNISKRRVSKGN